jgi:trans-aconitate 2-methyltransferase
MAADSWEPAQYQRFQAERRQPFTDLLSLLRPVPGGRVVDLGCGTGELTAALHRQLRAAETVGLDRSESMLAQSDAWAGNGVSFERRQIADFAAAGPDDGRFDVIAANASLQWVPGHLGLLTQLAKRLRPGGQLAFQVPANGDHPSHWVARELATEEPFATALRGRPGAEQDPIPPPEDYAVALHDLGFAKQVVRLQVYGHVLPSTAEVVEWVKGTLLTMYRDRLDDATYEAFVERYRGRLLAVLGDVRPYFYPFKRTLCWAGLPSEVDPSP